jgi:hypothetical protein
LFESYCLIAIDWFDWIAMKVVKGVKSMMLADSNANSYLIAIWVANCNHSMALTVLPPEHLMCH